MGAMSTKAALVEYKTVKIKDKGYVDTVPQLQVLGVGYDRLVSAVAYNTFLIFSYIIHRQSYAI